MLIIMTTYAIYKWLLHILVEYHIFFVYVLIGHIIGRGIQRLNLSPAMTLLTSLIVLVFIAFILIFWSAVVVGLVSLAQLAIYPVETLWIFKWSVFF